MKKFFAVVIMLLVISQSVIGIECNVISRNPESSINAGIDVESLPETTWEELEGVSYTIYIETDDYIIVEVDGGYLVIVK